MSSRRRSRRRRTALTRKTLAADMLRKWDGVLSVDSGPAALYVIWLELHLRPAVQAYLYPQDPALFGSLDNRHVLRIMAEEKMHDTVVATLDNAFADVC